MAPRQKILLLGATGETGASILNGLLASNQFDVEILVRPSSAEKPAVQELKTRGVALRVADITAPEEELVSALAGIDILISAIGPNDLLQQKTLVRAAKSAGVKRFVPCAFITVAPPKGVMLLRDEKEEIYNEIKRLEVPYTVIDVGFWHQISIPPLPSGRIDYALMMPEAVIHGDGNAPNLLTDLRDIGRFVARIVDDERTLNRYVYTWSDVLSENEIFELVEEGSGEKIERKYETAQQIEKRLEDALAALSLDPTDPAKRMQVYIVQYVHSKYVRGDNQPRYAKYLGYLDARELYPDLKPVSFRESFVEVLEGKGKRPYY
ncbi:aromatic alcohol reductase [Aspergillus puulaauensis]|uniref:NmrA-like domain-containing protein n=1 Tax=Aspergillus puulaauensis TaxID=1220207 RepID=A0A7R7XC03_9EURO|nr:uncharacterized protein APUU_11299S [Aspergillus puulaauensis]BCS18471.1 hypothetical protein APUU_11299S [Aspergillus puulaauensis]